ncbi:imelysin family protein [Marinomonas sp. 15G1-11]|uniref:Imelysin family protein n=1 Tax=Marinomonas phaeophyticola TaxID=3004091 RepID=A0ABT4JVS2_9GAMM|nr:imelysin family protein [Marinomonas sp. 15G1-11]MCZ2722321.1 imelysin family protein [Marinomonas sp. 15G1-11]
MAHTTHLLYSSGLLISSLLFSSVSSAAQWQGPLEGIQNTFLKPKYQEYHESAETLSHEIQQLCAVPNEQQLSSTRTAFEHNMLDWQEVQWLNFGPVSYFMRFYGFQFWPDKKSITTRQLRTLKQNIDSTYKDGFWKKASIAVKGLTAIEAILYRDSFNPINDSVNCNLLYQIAQHHADTTGDIAGEWQNHTVEEWVFAEEDSDTDLHTLALEQLLQQWLEHLSVLKDSKIEVPLGYNDRAKPKMAEFYQSKQSLNAIKQNLQTYIDLYHSGTPSLYDLSYKLYPEQSQALDDQFLTSLNIAQTLPSDLFMNKTVANTEASKHQVALLVKSISQSQSQLQQLIVKLGFNIGFNSRDGD